MSQGRVIQVPLDILKLLHVADRRLALVDDERVIKVDRERDKDYEDGNDDDGAGGSSCKRVVPELDPAEDGDLDEEEEETEDSGEGPGELDEATHPLVRWLGHQTGHLQFTDRLDVRQEIRAYHQGEDVNGDQDCCADGEHDEEPLGHSCWLVYLELHHCYLWEN